jgi:hypothetical protein
MIFAQLSYKRKYYLLIAGIVIFLLIAYSLSFKNTISAVSDYFLLDEKRETLKDAPQKIRQIEHQMKQMEHFLVSQDGSTLEEQLLEKTTQFCKKNQLTLIGFPQTLSSEYQDYLILTNEVVIESSFKESLRFIYDSELIHRTGMVASVQLIKKQDMKTKRQHLFTHIFFQNIQLKQNEK